MPPGRPCKLNDKVMKMLYEYLMVGAAYEHACGAAGISFDAFNEWRKKGIIDEAAGQKTIFTDLNEVIKKAEGEAVKKWCDIIDAAAAKEWTAAAWKLERRCRKHFGKEKEQEFNERLEHLEAKHKESSDEK